MTDKKRVTITVSGEVMTGKTTILALISELLSTYNIENDIVDDLNFENTNQLKAQVKRDLDKRVAMVSEKVSVKLRQETIKSIKSI